jgi:SpoIVB peptidase S55
MFLRVKGFMFGTAPSVMKSNFFSLVLIVSCLSLVSTLSATNPDKDKNAPAKKAADGSVTGAEAASASTATKILPLDQVKTGMRGVAYTVFEGTKPEPMEVEVLGVLKNMNGPKSDMILIRLHGQKVEYTGVVAGMSGSPVYIDGKLMGALAFRIGTFSKEPIAGVTPIEEMLEINELDQTAPAQSVFTPVPSERKAEPVKSAVSGGDFSASAGLMQLGSYMTPIAAPLVFNGFSEETIKRFMPQFAAAGVMPVMGAGSSSTASQPEPIEPGSSVGIVLVRGDMDISATCTVTYIDPQRLLACGHPLMQSGKVDMPMTKSTVLATLPSPLNAFKIAMTTETVGSFMQDRHTGVMGKFGAEAHMVPVTLTLHGARSKDFHYEVLNSPKLTPVALTATVYNALQSLNETGEDVSYRLAGSIAVQGFPAVQMQDMFAPSDDMPTAASLAISLAERFGRIYENSYQTPEINSINLDVDLIPERRWAKLESARADVTEARPGDDVIVEAALRPYRGERIVRQIKVHVPSSTPKGTLRILVSDADTLEKTRHESPAFIRKFDLNATIASLNKERSNQRLYVSLLQSNPQAVVEDKVMPGLPLSVMNVMDGMRGTQDMVVTGESAVDESSTPLNFVVSGSQVITLTIK